jgi:hypothetical protein
VQQRQESTTPIDVLFPIETRIHVLVVLYYTCFLQHAFEIVEMSSDTEETYPP